MTNGLKIQIRRLPITDLINLTFKKSIKKLKNLYPQMTLFIFSDDLDFVRNNFKFDVPVEFVEAVKLIKKNYF